MRLFLTSGLGLLPLTTSHRHPSYRCVTPGAGRRRPTPFPLTPSSDCYFWRDACSPHPLVAIPGTAPPWDCARLLPRRFAHPVVPASLHHSSCRRVSPGAECRQRSPSPSFTPLGIRRRPLRLRAPEDITAACVKGTNATLKTWSTRRRTAIAFADFLSRTVCRDRSEPPPTQGQLDHRVRRAFLCMTPDTRSYITLFLEARQHGYPVAGSSSPITVLTLEDYSSALVFLFGEALMEGTTGGPKVVPDCEQRNSKWKQKGVAERAEEAKIREQPGSMIGNPMHTDVVKRYKSAAEKDARVNGEQSVTSAPVTAAMMHRLYATLVMSYLPGHGVPAGCTPPTGPDVAPPPGSATPAEKAVPSSLAKCDFIVYCLYAFAWMTLARPLSLISMKHKDVSLPDLSLPRNQEFMNR